MENIKLKKSSVLKIGIQTDEGIDTGNYLEIDLEDFEMPIKCQNCVEEHKKNLQYVRSQFIIISKKQDKKGKKLLSSNEEEKLKVLQEFYNREIKCLDIVLGEGGTAKILNGRKPYFTMFDDINEYLEPIMPLLTSTTNKIQDKIRAKYSKQNEEVIE